MVIYRMPRGLSIVWPPSHCFSCGRAIRWFDNLPIFSWLILRGRCRHCSAKISPQYVIVEAITGLLAVGLYAAYFIVQIRTLGLSTADHVPATQLDFGAAWPMFIAHAALLCGLLACSVVDWRHYIVPLPVMWTVSVIGFIACAVRPHPFLPQATPMQSAMALAAGAGIFLGLLALQLGLIKQSFADVAEQAVGLEDEAQPKEFVPDAAQTDESQARKANRRRNRRQRGSVGVTAESGVNPRVEVLREVLFLLPTIILTVAAWQILRHSPTAAAWWGGLFDAARHPLLAPRMTAMGGSIFGFMIGGLWIWGLRILATVIVGREAMGMGDVHILAGVGAVTGWAVVSLTFFVAPVAGIAVALYLFAARRQRELPYGPWLAAGTVLVMLFYDALVRFVEPGMTVLGQLLKQA